MTLHVRPGRTCSTTHSQVIIKKHKFHIHFISQFSYQLHLCESVSVLCFNMTRQMAGILKKFLLCLGDVTGGLKVKCLVSQKKDFTQPQRSHTYLHGYIMKQRKFSSLQQPNSLVSHSKHRFLTPFPFNKVLKMVS